MNIPKSKFALGDKVRIKVFRAKPGGDGWGWQSGWIARGMYLEAGPGFPRGGWWCSVKYRTPSERPLTLQRHEDDIEPRDPLNEKEKVTCPDCGKPMVLAPGIEYYCPRKRCPGRSISFSEQIGRVVKALGGPHPKKDSGGEDAATELGPIFRLTSNLSRIAGLANGCADAVELCREDANWLGVVRVFREIQALADALLPPQASPRAPEPSEAEGTHP